ncbi:Ltp family lipoprotein [Eubacteriaceae bacterium ES2]|nr:Ltp family lipoprotein [Eubacteriaceae bacterium ES2]
MKKSIQKLSVLLLALLLICGMVPAQVGATYVPVAKYQTHVQNVGWQDYVFQPAMSGTEGKGLRLEGIRIGIDDDAGYDIGLSYQTHIENIGWEDEAGRGWKATNEFSGTEGLGYRLEAIQIKLTGSDAELFDVYYRVHAQNVGWMGWAMNGESAGTAGYGYRLEGIEIEIVPAGSDAPGTTENCFIDKNASQPTTGQLNALDKANTYLGISAFSYTGLISQLEYSGFTNDEATYAADNCGANWSEQALKKAKAYLDISAFSYTGLVAQLEYDGFTNVQAGYGADNCGADWNEQAAKKAQAYLDLTSFSRSALIDQLIYDGFTADQAEYGVTAVGY